MFIYLFIFTLVLLPSNGYRHTKKENQFPSLSRESKPFCFSVLIAISQRNYRFLRVQRYFYYFIYTTII